MIPAFGYFFFQASKIFMLLTVMMVRASSLTLSPLGPLRIGSVRIGFFFFLLPMGVK